MVSLMLNAVKCNLTKLTTKKSWHSSGGQWLLVVSACVEHCIVAACSGVAERSRLFVEFLVGLFLWQHVQAWQSVADFLWSFWLVCLCFSAPPPPPFFPLPLLMQCDGCPDNYVWGLMAGL